MSEASGNISNNVSKVLGRVRAWFLIKITDLEPKDIAQEIYNRWINPQGKNPPSEELAVIRVDVVNLFNNNSCDFDLIVPVDALDGRVLEAFKNDLQTIKGIGKVIVANVKHHFPEAPYLSNGYISIDEARLGLPIELPESVRLTRQSPGDNPWG